MTICKTCGAIGFHREWCREGTGWARPTVGRTEEELHYDQLLEFRDWIISLDDDDPESPGRKERQTITLTKIIDKARAL